MSIRRFADEQDVKVLRHSFASHREESQVSDLKPLHEIRLRSVAVGVFEVDRRPLSGGPWTGAMVRIGSGEALQLAAGLVNAVSFQMPDLRPVGDEPANSEPPPS